MDAFAIHPYPDNSSQPPTVAHPLTTTIGIADYGKLVALLGEAFDDTAQRGSDLPILYGEFGVESEIPATKATLYTGTEPTTTKPVVEETQAAHYEQALALAFCQPTVEGMLIFLSRDERARASWQSGVFYVDGTPKKSLPRVREALDRTTGGSITRCPGVELVVRPTFLRFGTRSAAKRGIFRASLRCDLDCAYQVRLEKATTHSTKLVARGRAGGRRARAGRSRITVARARKLPLHAPARAPGEPRASYASSKPGVHTAVGAALVGVLEAPDADDDVRARREHDNEGESADTGRESEPDRESDVHNGQHDRRVEELPVPLRPRLEISPPLPPEEEEEEGDGEEERDL